jgi:hypothetical protein
MLALFSLWRCRTPGQQSRLALIEDYPPRASHFHGGQRGLTIAYCLKRDHAESIGYGLEFCVTHRINHHDVVMLGFPVGVNII